MPKMFSANAVPLDQNDQVLLADVIGLYQKVLIDLNLTKWARDRYGRFFRTNDVDVIKLSSTFSFMDTLLFAALGDPRFAEYLESLRSVLSQYSPEKDGVSRDCASVFKNRFRQYSGEVYFSLLIPLLPNYYEIINGINVIYNVKVVRTCSSFMKRVNANSLDLREENWARFLEIQDSNADADQVYCNTETEESKVLHACAVLNEVLLYDMPAPYLVAGSHGNGSVADFKGRKTYGAKNAYLVADSWLRHVLTETCCCDEIIDMFDIEHKNEIPHPAEFLVVPKSLDKNRSISKETTARQFLQTAIRDWWRHSGPAKTFVGRLSVDYSHPETSCVFARIGSIDRTFDTHDFSSASDTITRYQVKVLYSSPLLRLSSVRKLQRLLLLTRSNAVAFRRTKDLVEVAPLTTFAPMGSGVCFDNLTWFGVVAETLAAFCAYQTHVTEYKSEDIYEETNFEDVHDSLMTVVDQINSLSAEDALEWFRTRLYRALKEYRFFVYGDDHVCDSRLTPIFAQVMRMLNFDRNELKSFHGPTVCFREACGGEYVNGEDVKPMRLPRRLTYAPHLPNDPFRLENQDEKGW